jgi:hypothetical protein
MEAFDKLSSQKEEISDKKLKPILKFNQGQTYRPNSNPKLDEIQKLFRHYLLQALKGKPVDQLICEVDQCSPEHRGVAVEALAMGIGILDHLFLPQSRRWHLLHSHFAPKYVYALYIGLGMSLAKLGLEPSPFLKTFDEQWRKVIIDGYGFYCGYFAADKYIEQKQILGNLKLDEQNAFDQGLGRSLWFHYQGNLPKIYAQLESFSAYRRKYILCGLGTAIAYSGGLEESSKPGLENSEYNTYLASGIARAAKVRHLADNITEHTNEICRSFLNMEAANAAISERNFSLS